MTRNLKALGLAIVAVFAMSAMAASAAQAEPKTFHTEEAHTLLEGIATTNQEFNVAAGNLVCTEGIFHGTSSVATVDEQTVEPTYKKCHGPLGEVTVDMNGCHYLLTVDPATGTPTTGTVHINCPTKPIEVTAGICTVTVPSQTVGGITYVNEGSGSSRDVKVTANATGIHYIQHGIFCPGNSFSSSKTFTNGTYKGSVTVKGFDTNKNQKGVWVE